MYYQCDLFTDNFVFNREQDVVREALNILSKEIKNNPFEASNARSVKDFCRLQLATQECEIFAALFLDNQNRLITFKPLFRGTIDSCSVYVREVAKEMLALNAAAIIFTHNHPSGVCEPSNSDLRITEKLKEALSLFDVRVLDHIIVSTEGTVSLAERGYM